MTHEQAQKAQEIQSKLKVLLQFRNSLAISTEHSDPDIEEWKFMKLDAAPSLLKYDFIDKNIIYFDKINCELELAIFDKWKELQKQLKGI